MPADNHSTIAKLWTYLGWSLVTLFLPYMFYIRGGNSLIVKDDVLESLQITMAGWGVLTFGIGFCGLALLGIMHINTELKDANSKTPWPINTMFENDNRHLAISRFFFALFSGVPILSVIAGLIRYSDSNVSSWNLFTSLAEGFISSRIEAHRLGCSKLPCYRIHPQNGHEYIPYFTDGVLLAVTTLCIVLCIKWFILIFKKTEKQPRAN